MTYTLGELLDRYTIERRKQIYGAENAELLDHLKLAITCTSTEVTPLLIFNAVELALANDTIAILEWQIRADEKLSDEEVGKRAREVRNTNARRVAARARIDGTQAEFTPGLETPIADLTLAIPGLAK